MAQFEKYHPILTAHFELDWLTQFKVNSINELRIKNGHEESVIETAAYVNRQMSAIMSDQALIWGIGHRDRDEFIGLFGFQPINRANQTGQIILEIKNDDDKDVVFTELLPHMMAFADTELHLKDLIVASQDHLSDWNRMGFKPTAKTAFLNCKIS